MKNFISFSGFHPNNLEKEKKLVTFLNQFHLVGTEVYIAEIISREKPLYKTTKDKNKLLKLLRSYKTKRIHFSYWAEPTDFLGNIDRRGLLKRFKSKKNILLYFSDLNGDHIFNRWTQEYKVAKEIGAEAVTFHVIDYFHIDGLWEFTNSKKCILRVMVKIIQKLLMKLDEEKLLENGPLIELENAGFGLEYGAQTSEDFLFILKKLNDKYKKIKIGWDTNHLLHAAGSDKNDHKAKFFIPKDEKTLTMKNLEKEYSSDYNLLCSKWLEHNILDPKLSSFIGSIHTSDAPKKTEPIFIKGKMIGNYLKTLKQKKSTKDMEEYGAKIVLSYYDTHLPFTNDKYQIKTILEKLRKITSFSVLHELKNNELKQSLLKKQMKLIQISE